MTAVRTHLDDGQRALIERAEHVAAEHLAPIAAAGSPGRVNRALVAALAEHGLLTRLFPNSVIMSVDEAMPSANRHDHGFGVSAVDLCLLREGLARHCTEAETALALQGLGAYPIGRWATAEVATAWMPKVTTGAAVAALALTEPGAGSDAAALELAADRDGDTYRLTGEKVYISNAPDADIYTVFARTGGRPRARGITAFAVPGDAPGLSGEPLELLAPHPIGRLLFDGVPVPASHVIGELDGGWDVAMGTFDLFRPSVGAFAVGMAQAALDEAVGYAAQRQAFGRPLREFQGVSHQLADVATRLHSARLLVHAAATAYDSAAGDVAHLSAMAKLHATETAQATIDTAIQVCGARALERGHLLEHLYREVRATRIYEGASEIQREIVARHLFEPPPALDREELSE